jgi:Uma2 family endonuclease
VATPTKLMTFAEFDQVPDPEGPYYLELHQGEPVEMPSPRIDHLFVQKRLVWLLDAAGPDGAAIFELGFRALPEHEYRVADVAYCTRERWAKVDRQGQFMGVPEIVVEVLSPSNTVSEMLAKEQLCLQNGGREFWIVDIERHQVKVSTPDGHTITYKSGQQIPLFFASGVDLAVDAIFTD